MENAQCDKWPQKPQDEVHSLFNHFAPLPPSHINAVNLLAILALSFNFKNMAKSTKQVQKNFTKKFMIEFNYQMPKMQSKSQNSSNSQRNFNFN